MGRRLAMSRDHKHSSHTRSLDSPPPPPPSSPAPPLPPRVKAPSVPPPPPPVSPPEGEGGWGEVFSPPSSSKKRTPPPPLVIRHKRTYSEPSPQAPPSPHTSRLTGTADYGVPPSSRCYGGPESSFQKCVSGSPKYTVTSLNSLDELPERGFRTEPDSHSTHFLYPMAPPTSRAPPLSSPTYPHSLSLDANGGPAHHRPAPHPLPRRSLPRPRLRRVQAMYDCEADHHDELSFAEGEVLVVLGEEDADWWHGYVEGQPNHLGLFPSSFVHTLD